VPGSEEAVGFIEDDEPHAGQPDGRVGAGGADVVCETAWGGDDDVGALGEGDGLGAHVGAAGYEEDFEGLGGGDGEELLVDLEREFSGLWLGEGLEGERDRHGPCGCHDEGEDADGIFCPFLKNRHGECDGFS